MRKFFCLSAGLAACGIAGMASAGGPELQSLSGSMEVDPIRVAGIDADGNRTTPWFYLDNQNDAPCGTAIAYDSFEPVPGGGAPTGGTDCDPINFTPGTRWFFGPTYCNLTVTNGMTLATATGVSGESGHIQFGWYWYGDGNPLGTETCVVNVFHLEDWDPCVTFGNSMGGGVALDFGGLNTNPGVYYWTDVNTLCDLNLNLGLPADGAGAYQIQFRQDNQGTPATCAQPMLWGQKDSTGATQGESDINQWDDDNPANGIYDSVNECYTYSALCPDDTSLSAMYVTFGEAGPTDCITLEVDRVVAGLVSTFTVTQTPGAGGNRAAIVWGTNLNGTSGSAFGYCYDFAIGGVGLNRLIGQPQYVGGVATQTQFIPGNAQGLTVHFQAAEQTCPDPCMSNVLTETVN